MDAIQWHWPREKSGPSSFAHCLQSTMIAAVANSTSELPPIPFAVSVQKTGCECVSGVKVKETRPDSSATAVPTILSG